MGSSKRSAPVAATTAAKDRHKRSQRMLFDPKAPLPEGLVAKPSIPKLKHRTYFEIMENKDKKKKLEFQVTTDKKPPPGFEFVPMGNPALTTACKELSRERDAMIFIVSNLKDAPAASLSHQVHRIGHHIRQSIVEEARSKFDVLPIGSSLPVGEPEPIPTSQMQYNAQVDAAIRDLFPRIPNTDRQIIIEHAFDLSARSRKGEKPVGLSADITLARRVQLAVLAHIRHTHTRYDELLKETTWVNARRVVEALCLDILVKWRGDEETGRDQLDDILQEVVVISDSEDSDEDDPDGSDLESDSSVEVISPPGRSVALRAGSAAGDQVQTSQLVKPKHANPKQRSGAHRPERARASGKKEQRGFKRYRAWQEAIQRNRAGEPPSDAPTMHESVSHGPYPPVPGDPPPYSAAFHAVPDSRFGDISTRPNRAPEVSTPEMPSGSRPLLYERMPVEHLPQTRMDSVPPPRLLSPPIQDRFKDLLVQSIEQPASPDVMQPSFVRTIPSKSPEPRTFLPIYEGPTRAPLPGALGNAPVASPQGSPYHQSFGGQQRHQAEFPGGFIQVSRRVAPDVPRPYPPAPAILEPLLPQSRVRPRAIDHVGDSRPAKRPQLEPSLIARPIERFYMEDRGGFLEKLPLHQEGSRSMPPDPGFIEIRRQPDLRHDADRVVSYEEGRRLRNEPGVEIIPISSSPAPLPGHPLPGDLRPQRYNLDHFPPSPYQVPPKETIPAHHSQPQRVFRYVRGNEPGAHHPPPHQPFDEYIAPHHEPPLAHHPAHWEYRHREHQYGNAPDRRSSGRHSYTPALLD